MAYPSSIDAPSSPQGTTLVASDDHALQHRTLGAGLVAVENKLGLGSGSAAANQILVGSGAGTSAWGTVWNNATLGTPRITGGTVSGGVIGTNQVQGGTVGNAVIGTPTVTVGSDAQGDIYYRSSGGGLARLAPGTAGQFLQTQGAGSNPLWASASGKTLQVVAVTYSTQGSTTSASLVDSGLAGTITPASTSNKVLVQFSVPVLVQGASTGGKMTLVRGTTEIYTPITNYGFPTDNTRDIITSFFYDSPSTTSATTYKIQYARNTGSGSVFVQGDSATSSIVLTEIGA